MSYPRYVRTLIVEDNDDMKELYEHIFKELPAPDVPVSDHCFAFSHDDAIAELRSDRVFHLVILDLSIPERSDSPHGESVSWGAKVLGACLARDNYPIPAVLVITGHAERTEQSALRARLEAGFAYGALVVKGSNPQAEILHAIRAALVYLDVGIHIKDSVAAQWPTLSPREEDLLRRAVVKHRFSGVDISWWSAEYSKPTGSYAEYKGWTKALMGRFLLPGEKGASRINFFKFAPAADASVVVSDAQLLEHKLSHVKVSSHIVGGDRMLLVTEKTGRGNQPPVPLDDYLSRPLRETFASIERLAQDVFEQLQDLGGLRAERRRPRDLLWCGRGDKFHDAQRIGEMLSRYRRQHPGEADDLIVRMASPLDVLAQIRASERLVGVQQRECVHDDLNVTNVAIDIVDGAARAYVFDASGSGKGYTVFDVAMLEVTSLLHVPRVTQYSTVELSSRTLYGDQVDVPVVDVDSFVGPDRVRSVLCFVRELRRRVIASGDEFLYAFAVFDQVLVQVGGLSWSGNKIVRYDDAVLLADVVAGWFQRVAAQKLLGTWDEASASVRRSNSPAGQVDRAAVVQFPPSSEGPVSASSYGEAGVVDAPRQEES